MPQQSKKERENRASQLLINAGLTPPTLEQGGTVKSDKEARAAQLLKNAGIGGPPPLPIPTPEPIIEGPSVFEQTGQAFNEVLAKALGAPVDIVTSAVNLASKAITGEPLLDPSKQIGGAQSQRMFAAGSEAGLLNVGRGLGIADPQTPEQIEQQRQLAEDPSFFTGELLGEVAPASVVVGPIGGIKSFLGRALATGITTALEGGVIAKGRGGSLDEIKQTAGIGGGLGFSLEIAMPAIGRVASKVIRKIGGKLPKGQLVDKNLNPTPELQRIIREADLTEQEFVEQTLREIQGGADPIQAERMARFQKQRIPTTKGVITQDDILLGQEETLLGRVDEAGRKASDPLRQRKAQTSLAFERNADELVEDLGLPDDVGRSVKDALTQRRKLLVKEKNALYKAAGEADPELVRVPIVADNIVDAIPNQKTFSRIGRLKPTEAQAVDDLLVEFGLDQTPAKVEKFVKGGNIIEPLSFSNFEDFRQSLNAINRADQTGTISNLTNPIINVLDGELDTAFKAMSESPNIKGDTLEIIKKARSVVRELKVEFDPRDITQKLIGFKKGNNIPIVESSEVFKTITKPSTSVEATRRIVRSLSKGGDMGVKALGDFQASVVLQALNDATSATSIKSGGRQLFSPNAFVRSLNKINGQSNKLDAIFSNNKPMLKILRDLEKSARETVTPSTTKPKGSAPAVNAILGFFSSMRNLPLIKGVGDAFETAGEGVTARAALRATPAQRKTIEYINREFPSLAAVLGVGVTVRGIEENDQ